MKNFISNPKLFPGYKYGIISLENGEFYFSFHTSKCKNFTLSFSFQSISSDSSPNDFSISNIDIASSKNYENEEKNGKNYTYLSNVNANTDTTFFEDTIFITTASDGIEYAFYKEGSPGILNLKYKPRENYKKWDSETGKQIEYILPDSREQKYSVSKSGNSFKLSREMKTKTTLFKTNNNIIKYYYDENNPLNSAVDMDWKIIISQNGNSLSIFNKSENESSYKEIETISYIHDTRNCFISLSINDDLILSSCSFRFFKANIS